MWLINPVRILAEILQTVRRLEDKEEVIMAKIDDVQAVLDSIPPVLDAIAADEGKLMAEIQALKDQIAAGGTVTEAQLQAALDSATAIKARLDAIDTTV
jgi:capsule polysaccharide export protein KpsE/RkpR